MLRLHIRLQHVPRRFGVFLNAINDVRDLAEHILEQRGQPSLYLDVKVVDETNTKAEKARYVAEAFEAFAAILGDLLHESYVYVQDVPAAAYGFGGRTQEYRHQHPDQ